MPAAKAKPDKPLVWLSGEIGLPHSRPMPSVGGRCHELRVNDADVTWRIIYHVEVDAVVILDVFAKKTAATPKTTIESCQRRLAAYRKAASGKE